ncbi:MAG: hypothetical protein PVI81_00040 [Anaerolineales bacterium]|jgi:hypothetical protein
MQDIFPVLILNARPAAGKSEIIHALQSLSEQERTERFHIGPMHIIDDFPMIWAWFEEDRILQDEFHHARLHTTPDEYFLFEDLWHVLIRRLSLEYTKWSRDTQEKATAIIEFSRGEEHGGYSAAYPHLDAGLLQQASSLYVNVSYEESRRKNHRRFNPNRPDSILEHGLSEEKLQRLYRNDDWSSFSNGNPEVLEVGEVRVPYVVFENEDDVTTPGGKPLYARLHDCLDRLWMIHRRRSTV